PGAQTGRRGGAGPAGGLLACLAIRSPPAALLSCRVSRTTKEGLVEAGAALPRFRSLRRRAAEFLQALAALLPGGGVQYVDDRQLIHFETGNHLSPELDPLRIAANGLWDLPQPRRPVARQ